MINGTEAIQKNEAIAYLFFSIIFKLEKNLFFLISSKD